MKEWQPTQGAAGHPGRAPGLPTPTQKPKLHPAMNAARHVMLSLSKHLLSNHPPAGIGCKN